MGKLKTIIAFLIALLPLFSLTAIPASASATYSYDANGNLTSDGVNCYTYNDANQVSQVKNCVSNQVVAQYTYDYQGNRLVKKNYVNGALNNTVYSPDKGYETKKLANNTTQNTSYYFVNNDLVAKKNPDGTKNYYLSDNLQSTSVLTNQSGGVVENSSYYPFGAIRSGGTQSKYLYTGQQNDSETGLDYYNARYYSPQIRHFTQPDDVIADPYNPQNLNRYAYVNNNPLTYNDPTGHCFGPFIVACVGFVMAGPVVAANINPIIATVNQAYTDYQKNPTLGQAALSVVDASSVLPVGDGVSIIANTDRTARSFTSFSALKRVLGPAGDGNHWHHIVEQNAANIAEHGTEAIHNTNNVVRIPAKVNLALNGFFSSKQSFTQGLTVRQWIQGGSFEEKFNFGKQMLDEAMKKYIGK